MTYVYTVRSQTLIIKNNAGRVNGLIFDLIFLSLDIRNYHFSTLALFALDI